MRTPFLGAVSHNLSRHPQAPRLGKAVFCFLFL